MRARHNILLIQVAPKRAWIEAIWADEKEIVMETELKSRFYCAIHCILVMGT